VLRKGRDGGGVKDFDEELLQYKQQDALGSILLFVYYPVGLLWADCADRACSGSSGSIIVATGFFCWSRSDHRRRRVL